jgi:predicted transcriptional regulator
MQTTILLSIKPQYADKIFDGFKKFEFRRVIFKSPSVSRVVVYASSPVQRVVGEFEIDAILSLGTRQLWRRTKLHSGIEKSFFDLYFRGLDKGFAIKIKRPRRYSTPVLLRHLCDTSRPPQSFMYLAD